MYNSTNEKKTKDASNNDKKNIILISVKSHIYQTQAD